MNKKGIHEGLLTSSKVQLIKTIITSIICPFIFLLFYKRSQSIIEIVISNRDESFVYYTYFICFVVIFVVCIFSMLKNVFYDIFKKILEMNYINKKNYTVSVEKFIEQNGRTLIFQDRNGNTIKYRLKRRQNRYIYNIFQEGEEYLSVYLNNQERAYARFSTTKYFDDSSCF